MYICKDNTVEIYFKTGEGVYLNIELLQKYLSPCFEVVEISGKERYIDIQLMSFLSKNNFEPIIGNQMEACLLHLGRPAHRKISGESLWVCYDTIPISYYADINGITMFSDFLSEVDYYDLVRLLMAVFEIKQLKRGYIRCHMALLQIDDLAVALIGDKNAGKTTFMCNLLNTKQHTVSFGANDKCYVKVREDGLYALGSFEYIGIRNVTGACFRGLESYSAFEASGMSFYWPGDLIRYFNKDYLGEVKIDFAIAPSINMSVKELECVKYKLSYDAFSQFFFEFSDENHMNWLTKVLIDIHSLNVSFINEMKKEIYNFFTDNGLYQVLGNPYDADYLCSIIKESRFLS